MTDESDPAPIVRAIELLKAARNLLVSADAPKAAAKVRAALKSAEGALRHAQSKSYRSMQP